MDDIRPPPPSTTLKKEPTGVHVVRRPLLGLKHPDDPELGVES